MRSLNARLILSASVWIAVVLLIGGVTLSFIFKHSADSSFQRRLEILVNALVSATEFDESGEIAVTRQLGDPRFEQVLSGWYWQISVDHNPVARSRSLWDTSLTLAIPEPKQGKYNSIEIKGPRNRTLWAGYRFLQIGDDGKIVTFMVAGDISDLVLERRKFDFVLIVSLIALGVGVFLALVVQTRFGLKPLRKLIADLESIRGHNATRLPENYPDEVLPLIKVTNAVLEDNKNQVDRARRHVGNLAHALKTPLTLLRGELLKTEDEGIKSPSVGHIDSMSRLVEYHLARAAAAGTSSLAPGSVSLNAVVCLICESLEKIFSEKGVRARIDFSGDHAIRGEQQDIEEIFGNLLENAFKWAKSSVRVSTSLSDDDLHITVADDGPGMPPEEIEAATYRGRRLDEMTPGHGLGLSIVTDLVDLYKAELKLGRSDLGGLSATVVFPSDRLVRR